MRKSAVAILILMVTWIGAAPQASAEIEAGTHEISVFAGTIFGGTLLDDERGGFTNSIEGDANFWVGGKYLYHFTRHLAVEGVGAYGMRNLDGSFTADVSNTPFGQSILVRGRLGEVDHLILHANVVFHFDTYSSMVLYLSGGAGLISWQLDWVEDIQESGDDSVSPMFSVGGGARFEIHARFDAYVEAKDYIWKIDPDVVGEFDWTSNFSVVAGLSFKIG